MVNMNRYPGKHNLFYFPIGKKYCEFPVTTSCSTPPSDKMILHRQIFLQPFRTVSKVINFPRYNIICSGGNVIICGIFYVVSCFPLHFMLYRGNLDCFSNSAACCLRSFTINPSDKRNGIMVEDFSLRESQALCPNNVRFNTRMKQGGPIEKVQQES